MKPIDGVGIINEILERRGLTPGRLAWDVGLAASTLSRVVYKTKGHQGGLTLTTLNKIIEWDNRTPSADLGHIESFGG